MEYDSTAPASGINLSAGRPVVLANFAGIETYISRDHESFDLNSADSGKHKAIRLLEGAAPTTLANELGLYNKVNGGISTLYLRKEGDGTEIQLTGSTDPTAAATGQTFLAGGIILKWGSAAIVSAVGGTEISFVAAFPNDCFDIQVTPLDANPKAVTVVSKTKSSFFARGENAITIMWRAIGN